MGRYKRIMEKIEVTEDMHARILRKIQMESLEQTVPETRAFPIKKYLRLAACFALLLVGVLMIPSLIDRRFPPSPPVLVNPEMVECASLEELEKTVNFRIDEITALPFAAESRTYMAYGKELAQITYQGENRKAVFRASAEMEDNSGDYTLYEKEKIITVDEVEVTLKGAGDTYTLGLWAKDGFSYSLKIAGGAAEAEWRTALTQPEK